MELTVLQMEQRTQAKTLKWRAAATFSRKSIHWTCGSIEQSSDGCRVNFPGVPPLLLQGILLPCKLLTAQLSPAGRPESAVDSSVLRRSTLQDCNSAHQHPAHLIHICICHPEARMQSKCSTEQEVTKVKVKHLRGQRSKLGGKLVTSWSPACFFCHSLKPLFL